MLTIYLENDVFYNSAHLIDDTLIAYYGITDQVRTSEMGLHSQSHNLRWSIGLPCKDTFGAALV